jgi:hypothetical protein
MPVSYESLAIAALVVAFAYFIFGVSGFGAAVVAVPALSHLWPMIFVLPLCVLLDFSAAVALGMSFGRAARRDELKRMVPLSLVGAVCGLTLLVTLPRDIAMGSLGFVAVAYGLWTLRQGGAMRLVSQRWAMPAGFAGGLAGTLFGVGGPPYMIYLSRRLEDKGALRATMVTMVTFSVAIRTALFVITGLVLLDVLKVFGLLLPFAGLGLWLGSRLHGRISREQLGRFIAVLVMVSGASLLWRVFAGA